MRRIDKLNGLKAWWNSLCKPQYKIKISAEQLKSECISEYENTGSVEMSSYQAKDLPTQFLELRRNNHGNLFI